MVTRVSDRLNRLEAAAARRVEARAPSPWQEHQYRQWAAFLAVLAHPLTPRWAAAQIVREARAAAEEREDRTYPYPPLLRTAEHLAAEYARGAFGSPLCLPEVVCAVLRDHPEVWFSYLDCGGCGYIVPFDPGRPLPPGNPLRREPRKVVPTCPLCGGEIGWCLYEKAHGVRHAPTPPLETVERFVMERGACLMELFPTEERECNAC